MANDYLDEAFTAPVRTGIQMVENDGRFNIAISLYNQSDEEVELKTMNSSLFSPVLEGRDAETGYETIWDGRGMALQAETFWGLDPESRVTRHYEVPNREDALKRAQDFCEDFPHYDPQELLEGPDFKWVEPEEAGIVTVKTSTPGTNNYTTSISRSYDLRRDMEMGLDDELTPATEEHLDSW